MTDIFSTPQNHKISNSLEKFNRAASEGRFRIKSLRVKTNVIEDEKNYHDN